MGKFKDMLIKNEQDDIPTGIVSLPGYADTKSFTGESLVDAGDDGEADAYGSSVIEMQAPTAPKQRQKSAVAPSLPSGSLIENMDLTDPGHVAELAARFARSNASMKRLANEKASVEQRLEHALLAGEALQESVDQLGLEKADLLKELVHAKEKLDIATKSSGAIFERTALGILKWGGIGTILIFASAFFYY